MRKLGETSMKLKETQNNVIIHKKYEGLMRPTILFFQTFTGAMKFIVDILLLMN